MLYTVKEILEDIDYGCEERLPVDRVKAVVVLEADDITELSLKMDDQLLLDRGIGEGDRVYIDEQGKLEKAIVSDDWTKDWGSKDIDLSDYFRKIEEISSGSLSSFDMELRLFFRLLHKRRAEARVTSVR